MVERIFLPARGKRKPAEGTVLRWHISEGTPLRPGTSLLTIQMGNDALAVSLRKGGRGLVLKEKAIAEGERIAVHDTLAIVGNANERICKSTEKENVPVFGTAQYRRRLKVYRNVVGSLLLLAIVLIAFSSGLNAFSSMTGLVLSMRTAVSWVTPIVLTLDTLLFSSVCAIYLCQIPPEMSNVLSFRKEPAPL